MNGTGKGIGGDGVQGQHTEDKGKAIKRCGEQGIRQGWRCQKKEFQKKQKDGDTKGDAGRVATQDTRQ